MRRRGSTENGGSFWSTGDSSQTDLSAFEDGEESERIDNALHARMLRSRNSSEEDATTSGEYWKEKKESSESEEKSIPRAKRIAARKIVAPQHDVGITLDGQRVFDVPATHSLSHSLFRKWYTLPSLLAYLGFLTSIFCTVVWANQPFIILVVACMWRLMYNGGVGWLLRKESKENFLTQWITRVRRRPFSPENTFWSGVLRSTMPNDREVINNARLPPSFAAWVAFRSFVIMVESNDVLAFTLMAVSYGFQERPTFDWPLLSPLIDLVGVVLVIASLGGKVAAMAHAGDPAWFWFDFFFLRTGTMELTYAGVFALFPHPMYTVGYGWMYGCALLSRSYQVLACAMGFHFSQLIFLILIEAPHVDELYGSGNSLLHAEMEAMRDGVIHDVTLVGTSYIYLLRHFDIYRAADVLLILSICLFISSVWVGSFPGGPFEGQMPMILIAVGVRLASALIKGLILIGQEKDKRWTRHYQAAGRSRVQAFENWKRIYLLFGGLETSSFIMCAIRFVHVPDNVMTAGVACQVMLGVFLVVVALWAHGACYQVMGDFGTFYGDFFLPPARLNSAAGPAPTYDGLYRYLNNPDTYLGHLWMYGLAVLASSPEVLAVAILGHGIMIAFLNVIEKPHLRAVYKQQVRTESTALGRAIVSKVSEIRRSETALFLANWVKHPVETGALAPSSEQLAEAMCDTMDLGDNSVVVELGPGTGPFTAVILKRLSTSKNATYLAFELSKEFVDRLCDRFPDHKDAFLLESAERIVDALHERGLHHADTVISGLPWAIFPKSLQRKILLAVYASLRPGGRFCTFAYLQGLVLPAGQNFKALLDETFEKVERSNIVWANLPPAFVYRCEKQTGSR
ncbi:Phosphatidylethanolamine N-methyltransferase [Hondaea fermentalgiana]|uniref:Phosphatidylethanolamine N-methyltransferase n=1 Tax=Hondaea fermentalgiana TaxID=2315210 RepID=A0A2R5GBC1_9STRA|nr:Phosphatidylethanolamine N-methyltransferase [Hondaea fermentalgiana]|eukprot:GBG27905.1 Phosphatidylethanolamine N-methyltransferase [Hondaea fermentalgiana]